MSAPNTTARGTARSVRPSLVYSLEELEPAPAPTPAPAPPSAPAAAPAPEPRASSAERPSSQYARETASFFGTSSKHKWSIPAK